MSDPSFEHPTLKTNQNISNMKTNNLKITLSLFLLLTLNSLVLFSCEKDDVLENQQSDNVQESTTESGITGYPVVDTNQSGCYNNYSEITQPSASEIFYGQDAQFDGNLMQYTLSDDALTVYDEVTGLTWMRSGDTDDDGDIDADDKLAYSDINAYIEQRNADSYGGYSDWRLPSMKELYSLMDFDGTDLMGVKTSYRKPFINTDYFIFEYGDTEAGDREIDAQYYSSDVYTGTIMGNGTGAFGLNLADGRIKCYPIQGVDGTKRVQLCRGNTSYGINDFTDNGDSTITDQATGLMWTKMDFGAESGNGPRSGMLWKDALALAQTKNTEKYLGYSNWRLPNAKELQSIVDYSRGPDVSNSAAIDPLFSTTEITNETGVADFPWYWSSTTHIREDGSGTSAVYLAFGRAMGYWQYQWTDVHGAGCQRSDNKAGDYSEYIYVSDGYYFSESPQGDACRCYNYVRLVRDVE